MPMGPASCSRFTAARAISLSRRGRRAREAACRFRNWPCAVHKAANRWPISRSPRAIVGFHPPCPEDLLSILHNSSSGWLTAFATAGPPVPVSIWRSRATASSTQSRRRRIAVSARSCEESVQIRAVGQSMRATQRARPASLFADCRFVMEPSVRIPLYL
jgi:hypothetical protein